MSRMNLGASVKAASEKAFAAIIESKELAAAIGGALGERARSGGEFAAYLAKARKAEGRVAVDGSEGPAAGKALAAASEPARKPEARQAQKPVEPRAEGKAPKRPLLTIKTVEDFEEMVLGSKIPVVVIFKNDDSISSNRMVKKAMKALQAPGPAYALALVDANCADEEVHETWAAYSSYPELMAFSGGEQWDMDQVFNAGELSESQYGEYVALLAKVSAPPAAKPKEGAKPKTRSM